MRLVRSLRNGIIVVLGASLAAACAPSRDALFDPVAREVDRRVGREIGWHESTKNGPLSEAAQTLLREPLALDAAVRLALARNRRLQADFEALGIAGASLAAATVLPPTEVDFNYKFAVSGPGGETELTVVQDVLDLIQLGQRRGIAGAERDAARARAVAATITLVAAVETAWYAAVAAVQELELRQTALDAAAAGAELATRMHDAGNASDLELARQMDVREQAQLERDQAEAHKEERHLALGVLLGLPSDVGPWSVVGRLPEVPKEPPALADLEAAALGQSLDLAANHAEAEAAASALDLAEVRAWLPTLGLGAALAKRDGEGWEVGPSVRIGLPIFDHQEGPRGRAESELRRARDVADALRLEVPAAARRARTMVLAAHAEATRLHDVVLPLRNDIVDELVRHYNAMNASTFELLAAKRELALAGSAYVDALRRYWSGMSTVDALRRGVLSLKEAP
ncbi:MAG: TolC family protein [Myxococcota bacterium]